MRLQRLREKSTRRLIAVILCGKMLGVVAILFATTWLSGFIDTSASAATTVTHRASDLVNPINTIWVLVTAFLVFFMQAGFMALEAGFARSRETVNVLTECVVDTFLCGLLFWAFGFAFMFGEGNSVIGHQFFLLHGAPATYGSTGVAFLAFWLFQFAFADTCSTITSGAMVGRTGFKGDLLYSIGVSGFIYPIFGHWVWGPVVVTAAAFGLMAAVKATRTLRVSKEGELEGLDLHEHGTPAYHLEPGLGTNVITVHLSALSLEDSLPIPDVDVPA